MLANGAGNSPGPALIVAIASMPADEYFAGYIIGLTNIFGPSAGGWLYIARTKNGTKDMWKHYFLNLVIPYIRQVRESQQILDENGNIWNILYVN